MQSHIDYEGRNGGSRFRTLQSAPQLLGRNERSRAKKERGSWEFHSWLRVKEGRRGTPLQRERKKGESFEERDGTLSAPFIESPGFRGGERHLCFSALIGGA